LTATRSRETLPTSQTSLKEIGCGTGYIGVGVKEHAAALKKLGKHKTAGGCLCINKLEDIDLKVLKEMIDASLKAS
jgi:hypothetical protein